MFFERATLEVARLESIDDDFITNPSFLPSKLLKVRRFLQF